MVKETCFDLIHVTDGIIELHGIRFQGNLGFIFFVGKLLPKLLGAVAVVVGVLLGVVQDQPTARERAGNGLWGHLGAQDTWDVLEKDQGPAPQQPSSSAGKVSSQKILPREEGRKSISVTNQFPYPVY